MFKKIIHYFASRNLEEHRIKTQCVIDQYEQAAAESHARIQNQAESYRHDLQKRSRIYENELQDYMQFLTEHIRKTSDHVDQLKQLQQQMFVCIGGWMDKSLSEQRLKLQTDKQLLLNSNIELLDGFKKEIDNLSQQKDRIAWRTFVSNRPPRVSTPKIDDIVDRFEREISEDAKIYKKEISRILSHIKLLNKQLREIRILKSKLIEEVNLAREKHRKNKQSLKEIHYRCLQGWDELRKISENYYCHEKTESELANEWLLSSKEKGSLNDIRQIIQKTNSDWKKAEEELSSLHKQIDSIKKRIQMAHNTKDFTTINVDKSARERISLAIKDSAESKKTLKYARDVLYNRRNKINEIMQFTNKFHPSLTVEISYELVSQDVYWDAIGLKTKPLQILIKERPIQVINRTPNNKINIMSQLKKGYMFFSQYLFKDK